MCGINGFNFLDKKIIQKMNDSIKHRGPDAEGVYIDRSASLGHRRLSILDLSENGKQPMYYNNKGREAIIVFNGEIYNFLDIRKELEQKGYKFKSNSDTEVILASYLEYGFDCVNKFNGMWAFCIYDLNKKILFLSRDRLGKKPIYYYFDGKKFIFSSEIKGILCHSVKPLLDSDAVDLYFSLGFIPSPYSIYKNIKKVEARQNLVFNLKEKKLYKNYYYEYPKYSPINDKQKLIDVGRELVKDAVRLRLISDVPLGAFLSGGLDSSTVVAEMINFVDKKNTNTFSIGFEGKYDESKYINIVKDFFETKHHHKYFEEKDFKDILEEIFYYYDEPFSDPSMFPTLFLSEFTRKDVTVSLSGDGGDEIFGGYPRHKVAAQLIFMKKVPIILRRALLNILPNSRLKQGIKASLLDLEQVYSESREDVYKPEVYKKIMSEKLKECLNLSGGDLIEAMILMDRYFNTLPDNYLTKVDRASMASALEVRCPFLDYRLIEYASKIPSELKASKSKNKILMKEIIKGIVPDEIINRKKAGFTPPIGEWLTKKEYMDEIQSALEELNKKSVISDEWKSFYEQRILKNNDLMSQNYKIRLFLFKRWFDYWKKKLN